MVWWTAHYAQSAAEVVRDAFVAKYPGVQVDFIRQTAQVVFERVSQSLKAGAHDAWIAPVTMKKGRPGHLFGALVSDAIRSATQALEAVGLRE